MNYYIITGTSRGLGLAIATKLLNQNNTIFCISRNKNQELIEIAKKRNVKLSYFKFDLNEADDRCNLMKNIFNSIDRNNLEGIYLISNASMLAPIKTVGKYISNDIEKNIRVNLISSMILVSEFIKHTTELPVKKRIINISSGAGKKPYFGWSCYCAAKSGLDLFTRCTAVEQDSKEYPVQILSFAPGIIDTKMQEQIRKSDKEDFIQLDRFINFKEEGLLLSPEKIAEVVLDLLFSPDFEHGGVLDIKDILN